MISLLFAAFTAAHAGSFSAYLRNREGLAALGRKDGLGAYRAFTRGLGEDPLNLSLQLNLAATFEQNEEFEKAAAVYRGTLAALPKDAPPRFEIYFNLGNALAAAKKIPAALAAYQEALELKPDSIEVKTNIEMLFAGGKGDGKGQSSEHSDQKDKDDKDQRSNQQKREDALKDQKPEKKDGEKPKPKPFESKELSPEDVKRILDEIKNQEQSIRADEYDKSPKDAPRGGKDW